MRINPITFTSCTNRKYTDCRPVFKGEYYCGKYYTDNQIKTAKKYQYVDDYYNLLFGKFLDEESGFFTSFDTAFDRAMTRMKPIEELVEYFQAINKQKDEELEKISKDLSDLKTKQQDLDNDIDAIAKDLDNEKRLAQKKKEEVESYLGMQKRSKKVKEILNEKFIKLAKAENIGGVNQSKITFPNGILISGLDEESMANVVSYCADQSDMGLKIIDFKKVEPKNVINVLAKTTKETKFSGRRNIIYIKNFDIYSKPDINNDEIIPKLKALLSNCSSQRKCTIFINYDKPKELSPEITADHRFDKIDVTDIKYKYKPKFKPYYKDYKMKYGITNDDVVELFCGNWGYNDKVLWINSRRTKDINAVLDNIIAIKELKKFKNVEKLQCPEPEELHLLTGFKNTYGRTDGYRYIYEKKLDY